jgi:hypothetical protein
MFMNKLFFIPLIFLLVAPLRAQVEVYLTYDDYQNHVFTPYTKVQKFGYDLKGRDQGTGFIKVEDDAGKSTFLYCDKFWGFKYKEILFRNCSDKYATKAETYVTVALLSSGKICYYLIGDVVIDMLNAGKTEYKNNSFYSAPAFFSRDIESEIYYSKNILNVLFKEPGFEQILTCFLDKYKGTYMEKKINKNYISPEGNEIDRGVKLICWYVNNLFEKETARFQPHGVYFDKEMVRDLESCVKAFNGK